MKIQTHVAALVIPGLPQRCIRCCEPLSKYEATSYRPGTIVASIGVSATVGLAWMFDVWPCEQFKEDDSTGTNVSCAAADAE